MIPVNNANGSVILSQRTYPIARDTVVKAGQVVKLAGGFVVPAAAAETGAILGVAAETHSGKEDALNQGAHGEKILVYDGPGLVFECAAPVIEATGGTASTIVSNAQGGMAAFAADDFNGGYLVLQEKGAGSANTDPVGTVKTVTDFADAAGTETFTVKAAGTPGAGDKFILYPPIGFSKGNLDAERSAYTVTGAAALPVKVVGYDMERGMLRLMAKKHHLGNGE